MAPFLNAANVGTSDTVIKDLVELADHENKTEQYTDHLHSPYDT